MKHADYNRGFCLGAFFRLLLCGPAWKISGLRRKATVSGVDDSGAQEVTCGCLRPPGCVEGAKPRDLLRIWAAAVLKTRCRHEEEHELSWFGVGRETT